MHRGWGLSWLASESQRDMPADCARLAAEATTKRLRWAGPSPASRRRLKSCGFRMDRCRVRILARLWVWPVDDLGHLTAERRVPARNPCKAPVYRLRLPDR